MAKIKPIRIERPSGRRSKIEQTITNTLVINATLIRQWLIDNDRVATGNTVNSIRVRISRQPQVGKTLSELRSAARSTGADGTKISNDLKKANRHLNLYNLGIVSGQVVGSPTVAFALRGRGAGKAPPVDVIKKWMIAKGVQPDFGSISQSAFAIARKIGREGTNPPFFTQNLQTSITRASTARMVNLIARPLAKKFGRGFVRYLMAMAKDFDNMTFKYTGAMLQDDFIND